MSRGFQWLKPMGIIIFCLEWNRLNFGGVVAIDELSSDE